MNRSKIEYCDHTWNPVTGCHNHCDYCYARRITQRFSGDIRLNLMAVNDYRKDFSVDGSPLYILDKPMTNEAGIPITYPFGFEPTLHRYRLDVPDKLKQGKVIFVGAMTDLFGPWVPDQWLDNIFEICIDHPIHNYLFLTKYPERYTQYGVPSGLDNFWYGTTITTEDDIRRFNMLPAGCNTFISIEPILQDIHPEVHDLLFRMVDWVIIGAETGRSASKVIPEKEWVDRIVAQADMHRTPVFMKDSLLTIMGDSMRRQYPNSLQKKEKITPKMKERLFGQCAACKTDMRKNEMVAISARRKRGNHPKHLAYLCDDCFARFCCEIMNIDTAQDLFKEGGKEDE